MTDTLVQRLALHTNLDCQVARRFAKRPTLLDTATAMVQSRWQQHGLSANLDPASLNLVSWVPWHGTVWIRPLAQAVVEAYCSKLTLHLAEGDDYLTHHHQPDPAWALTVELSAVEQLINQVAPCLIDEHLQQLIAYWDQPDESGQSPWNWYARYLRRVFGQSIDSHYQAASLPSLALGTARLLHDYPKAASRRAWSNTAMLAVSELSIDCSSDGKLDVDLASALLIERTDSQPAAAITLLYTLTGRLLDFSSRQALLEDIGISWPAAARTAPRRVTLQPSTGDAFEHQARGMLAQQVRAIQHVGKQFAPVPDPIALNLLVDNLSAMFDQCDDLETARRASLNERLPDWLRNADSPVLLHYSNLLADIAEGYDRVQGQFWLDGIDSAEDFANHQLSTRMQHDHPESAPDPRQVKVINHQVTATAVPEQGGVVQTGEINPVTYTLAQLAIGNLGLLKPGKVTLTRDGGVLPAWLSESYLRKIITELDIGSAYPAMLRQKMLDDPHQRQERVQLLTRQLRSQLPAQALELHLRGQDIDKDAAERIAQAINPQQGTDSPRWVIRPLGFIKSPGATPDHPRNTWLIEADTPAHFPCLLYRPLHTPALLQFADRLALFVALSTPGELQTDMLKRLAPDVRKIYAHGGFLEPHLFHPLDDTSQIPLSTPAPVQLASEPASTDPGAAIYQACVEETIERFREHAVTSEQTRLMNWGELGWLLLNSVLPVAGKLVNSIAWLAQMEVALAAYVESADEQNPTEHRMALVNLLVNIAMLLFSHALFRERLELQPEAPVEPCGPTPPASATASMPQISETPLQPELLDFSWASARRTLTASQQQQLMSLQATVPVSLLHSPAPSGPLGGLYLHENRLYAVIDGHPFEVAADTDTDQMRIIGPDRTPGPWIKRGQNGSWQLDLGLRLLGGMPLGKRIQQTREANRQALQDVTARIGAASSRAHAQTDALAAEVAKMDTDDPATLKASLARVQALAQFWEQYLDDFERLDTLTGGTRDFKLNRAKLLYQAGMARQAMLSALHELYQGQREQLLKLAHKQSLGESLSDADARIAGQRLSELAPLLEQLMDTTRVLGQHQARLQQSSSRSQPDINRWYESITQLKVTREQPVALRFLHVETLINRLTFVHTLSEEALYWLERVWDGIQLCMGQRVQFLTTDIASDEAKVRLLQGLREKLASVRRQLQNLDATQVDTAIKPTLAELANDLDDIDNGVKADLDELPSYPPTVTVAQLRRQLPGLIETQEHGLLLGEPRKNDASIVDIAGPDQHVPSRAYRLEDGNWVALARQSDPRPATNGKSLKRLLRESNALMRRVDERLQKLEEQTTGNFLPVEIEEQVTQQREDLLAQISAIEARLTAENQTDAAPRQEDAAVVVQALYQQSERLRQAAPRLRTQAALAQLPRMGDVQYLIEHGQVQVSATPGRTRLAKVKGRPADFMDEYAISHDGEVLWYAHFHYPALETPKAGFIVGHLKTAAQRYLTNNDPGTVYRAGITPAAAQRFFFNAQ
ncbi:hypothetical protein [Pseudomonas putida]|uniref:hypothetical protein n=1 Tax=Pseudomonas putida TaxID=303 RepID=UPI0039058242